MAIPHPTTWRLLDKKFLEKRRWYFLQSGMATLSILLVISVLSAVQHTVLVAAVGASSFIAFTMPQVESSRPRYLIGGYIIGILIGCLFHFLAEGFVWLTLPLEPTQLHILFGALATGVAIFLMVITNTEHPPAAGLALGFCISDWDLLTVGVVIMAIITISAIKERLKHCLINLL